MADSSDEGEDWLDVTPPVGSVTNTKDSSGGFQEAVYSLLQGVQSYLGAGNPANTPSIEVSDANSVQNDEIEFKPVSIDDDEDTKFWDKFRADWYYTPAVYNFSKNIMNRQSAGKTFVLEQAIKALYLTGEEIKWIISTGSDVPPSVPRNIAAVAGAISKIGNKNQVNLAIWYFNEILTKNRDKKYAGLLGSINDAIKILEESPAI